MTLPARRIRVCSRQPRQTVSKLLEETNDDLDRALQPHEDHRTQATGNGSRCSCAETSSKSPCPLTEAATEIPCSHFETEIEVIRSAPKQKVFRVNHWSMLPLATITSNSCFFRVYIQQRRMDVRISDVFFDYDDPEPDLQRSGEKRKEPQFPSVHRSLGQMVRAQTRCPSV